MNRVCVHNHFLEDALLTLKSVSRHYGQASAIDGLDLVVPDDSYVSLLGASGSGKTTLLRIIAGFEEPDNGTISLRGARLDGVPPHKRGVGFVFQNFALFPHLSVEDNVAFGLRYREERPVRDKAEVRERVQTILGLVGLEGLGRRAVGAISGGQKQRVALARTLIAEPKIVLLDEPLGALDANLRERMCDELRAIRQRLGISFLHVTGSETEALLMGDQVAVLADGAIAQIAPPDDLFRSPASATVARHLNAFNIISGTVSDGRLRSPVGALALPTGTGARNGQPMSVALPYDGIAVKPRRDEASDGISARFVTAEFKGPSMLSFFRAADGSLIQSLVHLSEPRPPRYEPDQVYALDFDPELLIAFPERAY
ncbi:ATP-binding cassette domain-containing protein [Jiella sp. 40Bstr34]|uniref:ATP-binding cassette domain-containing protein n=1 Tax=Jiella pacifica TaxID=2696469 RepID=A0A6N9SVZ8_9HYPH|nr:ATP-binding cassette domain-containing protein [Jiella pacifica]